MKLVLAERRVCGTRKWDRRHKQGEQAVGSDSRAARAIGSQRLYDLVFSNWPCQLYKLGCLPKEMRCQILECSTQSAAGMRQSLPQMSAPK